jgi:ribose transport system ATP-binding protein
VESQQARTLVSVRGATKRFGATAALTDVDLDVRAGRILALLGQNGAGKSTLIKILAGVYRCDGGEITIGGHPLESAAARDRIAFIHQDLALVEWMTVAENIALGTGYPHGRTPLISWRRARRDCAAALDLVAAHLAPTAQVADLGRADRSLVAIARALAADAEVIVLDEPTASLPADDCARLFTVLRALRERGHGVVYVSHRLDEVYQIADDVVVLRDGMVVGDGPIGDFPPERLIEAIVGHTLVGYRGTRHAADAPVRLHLDAVTVGAVGPVDLAVRAGEVVGMVGLSGAGQEEIGRALTGALPIGSGRATLAGAAFRPRSVAAAVRAGVGFVTSRRQEEGCALDLSVRENFFANPGLRGRSLRWMSPRRERREAAELVARFGVRPAATETAIASLSGGNQQKVMVGRWLDVPRHLVVLEEPTAGVDAGAKTEIYRLLDRALAQGLGVALISTDFEEVVTVCHRALIFVRGRVAAVLEGGDLTVANLTAHATAARSLGDASAAVARV